MKHIYTVCDICGKVGDTIGLLDAVQSQGIEDICQSCVNKGDKMLRKFRAMALVRVKRKLIAMKNSAQSTDEKL